MSVTTLLIDGDPQGSAASWAAWRRDADRIYSPTTVVLAGKAILKEGAKLSESFEHTVVDAGGRDSSGLRAALLLADRAIIPVGASNLDAAAMTDMLEIIDMVKEFNPGLDVRVLLTRIDVRTKDVGEMIKYLQSENLNIMTTKVYERVAYRRAVGDGAIVQEAKILDSQAAAEMESLYVEVLL